MAQLKNVSGVEQLIAGEPWMPPGQSISFKPNEVKAVYDEDLEKSKGLQELVANGILLQVGLGEPTLGPALDPVGLLEDWVLSTDGYIQFAPTVYAGVHGTPVTVTLQVANGVGIVDLVNSISTVDVSVDSGTINGVAGPVSVTFVNGRVTVLVDSTSAGVINMALANPTHPSVVLDVTSTATVTLS